MQYRSLLASALALFVSPLFAQNGTLKMQFVYDGAAAPQLKAIDPNKDAEFCGKHEIPNERLVVNSKTKGIKNVVVYVYTGRGGSKLGDVPPASGATHVLDNKGCLFVPHIIVAQAGDKLSVVNSDAVGHNANLNFIKNKPENPTIPPEGKHLVNLTSDEPAPIPVDCNIHPWMRAYVVVQAHPYVGISDENGNLVIENLPAGELTFRFFHEAVEGSVQDVKVGGKPEAWKSNRFTVTVKAGENDLGVVSIPASNFKP